MTPKKLYRLGSALAAAVGIPRSTIASAAKRGDIPTHITGCGVILVSIDQVRRWATRWNKKGIPNGKKPKR